MCRVVLNVTCLASWVFVMATMTVWELASIGTLNFTISRWKMIGIMSGVVLCCAWVVKNPRNDCVSPLCGVLLKVCGFRFSLGMESLVKRDLHQLSGMVLTSAPASQERVYILA